MVPRLLAFLPAGEAGRLDRLAHDYNIPESNTSFWSNQGHLIPEYWRNRASNDMLISERIPALSHPIRESLVDLYCPTSDELPQRVLSSTKDKDCLIQLYLGRRMTPDTERQRPRWFFTLRNFKLHLDQALDEHDGVGWEGVVHYARMMARSLAVCHWVAGVDASGVEYVLGGPPSAIHAGNGNEPDEPCPRRQAHLWMFDFDGSVDIEQYDREGMYKAALDAEYNDLYYPRPAAAGLDGKLWTIFEDEYLTHSRALLVGQSEREGLPEIFIQEWQEVRRKRVERMHRWEE